METKTNKAAIQKVIFDKTLYKFKNKDLFLEKTDKFNEMVEMLALYK